MGFGVSSTRTDARGPGRARLAVIANAPVPYRSPIWRQLSGRDGLDLCVFYGDMFGARPYRDPFFKREVQWDSALLDGYSWVEANNQSLAWVNWRLSQNVPSIRRTLQEWGATHVLIPGKELVYYVQALRAAQRLDLPVLYRADTHPPKGHVIAESVARWTRRYVYRRVSAVLCQGRYQFEEYKADGIAPERLVFSPYCVDNDYFEAQRSALAADRESLRRRYGFSSDTFVVGYVGKLYPHKRPLDLIRALAAAQATGRRFGLLMVGDGELKAECMRVAQGGCAGGVAFPGFLNQSELGSAYLTMDALIMPSSHETWGLVLNEAMVFRLPVIASDSVNSAKDLIRDGYNGFTYPVGVVSALAQRIGLVADQVSAGVPMGMRGWEMIQDYSPRHAADGIATALFATGKGCHS